MDRVGWGKEPVAEKKGHPNDTCNYSFPFSSPPPGGQDRLPAPLAPRGPKPLAGWGVGGSARGTHTAPSSQQTFFLPHFSFCLPCFPIHLAAFLLTTTPPAPFFPPVRLLSPTLNNAEPKHSRTQPIYYNRSILYIRRIHTIFGSRGCSQGGGGGAFPPPRTGTALTRLHVGVTGIQKKNLLSARGKCRLYQSPKQLPRPCCCCLQQTLSAKKKKKFTGRRKKGKKEHFSPQ